MKFNTAKVLALCLILGSLCFLLAGCSQDMHADYDLLKTESEVKIFVLNELMKKYNENFTIITIEKNPVLESDYQSSGGTSFAPYEVKDAYYHTFTLKDSEGITFRAVYSDPYTDGSERKTEESFTDNYLTEKNEVYLNREIISALAHINNYKVYPSVSSRGFHVFIQTDNSKKAAALIENLNNIIIKYYKNPPFGTSDESLYTKYNLYICKNPELFDAVGLPSGTELNKGGHTPSKRVITLVLEKTAAAISYETKFDTAVFDKNGNPNYKEYQKPENFQNIIFVYESEPNFFAGDNTPKFYVFGLN